MDLERNGLVQHKAGATKEEIATWKAATEAKKEKTMNFKLILFGKSREGRKGGWHIL